MGLLSKVTNAQVGLVQSGFDFLSSALDYGSQANLNRTNRQWQEEQAEVAYNRSVEQWNRENAYNSPAAQMQRYIDAGLNPNLIYGQLGQGLNSMPSVQPANTPYSKAPSLSPSVMDVAQGRLIDEQIKRLQTQNDNDTKMTDAQVTRFAHMNGLTDVEVKKASAEIDLTKARTSETKQAIDNMKVQWQSLSEDVKEKQFRNAFTAATQELSIQAKNEESAATIKTIVALSMARLLNIKADTALKWSGVKLNQQLQDESYAKTFESWKRQAVIDKQVDLITSQIEHENASTESVLWSIAGMKSYAETVYGVEGEGWFLHAMHQFTTGIDAAFKCAGQLIHGTSVVHQ